MNKFTREKYFDFDEFSNILNFTKILEPFSLNLKQVYDKTGVNMYDVVVNIDESMIGSLIKAINAEPVEEEIAKEVIFESLKINDQVV